MAFSINKVIRMACLLVVGLFTPRESIDKPTTQQTGHVNDVVHTTSHARGKPCLQGTLRWACMNISVFHIGIHQ